jgi:hypothetical protein
MNTEKIGIYINIFNTCILVTVGVFGYFFVERYNVENTQKSTELAIVETKLKRLEVKTWPAKEALEIAEKNSSLVLNMSLKQIAESEARLKTLDLDIKEVKERLVQNESRSNISLNVSTLLSDLLPTIEISCDKTKLTRETIEISCNQYNLGKYGVYAGAPSVVLKDRSTRKVWKTSDFDVKNVSGNFIPPNTRGQIRFLIVLNSSSPNLENAVASVKTSIKTQSPIVKVTKELLGDVISHQTIDDISTISHTYNMYFK